MKKIFIYIICLATINCIFSQDLEDALRYSVGETQGTARFKAMAGAFGALGGDISGVSINPAGSAIFSTSNGSFSASTKSNSLDVSYGGSSNKNSSVNLDLHQIGAAFVFENYKKNSPWKKFVLSVFYERLKDYDNEFSIEGTTNNSISSYFLQNSNGLQLGNISALEGETISQAYSAIGSIYGYQHQQAFLGYNSYILEPETETEDNILYNSNISSGSFYQQFDYLTAGNNGKLSANLAFQYNENIFLGLNLNSHFIDFEKSTYLFEENTNQGSLINAVNFQNKLYTKGEGFSLQLGTIIKIFEKLRFGFSYASPTWLTLREETTQYLATSNYSENLSNVVNPNVVNIFPEYNLKTPGKITGSLAYILGNNGIISFDYIRKNYADTSFDTGNNILDISLNTSIEDTFTISNSYKIGGELRNKNVSFRGGYKLQESPYKSKKIYGNLNGFSLGIGYNFRSSRIDLSYENSKRSISKNLYNSGNLEAALLDTKMSIFTLSLSINL